MCDLRYDKLKISANLGSNFMKFHIFNKILTLPSCNLSAAHAAFSTRAGCDACIGNLDMAFLYVWKYSTKQELQIK